MKNKYELTDETKNYCGITLHRIRALRDIPSINVKSGDLGGWVEEERNLSQYGDRTQDKKVVWYYPCKCVKSFKVTSKQSEKWLALKNGEVVEVEYGND